ncbi:Zinc finger protein [Pseudolycoriella hygida]|uniref:Zinc finger protein n=1 Tax=Pseudolycoriella hygida TaxID=35572 RepID=A0A9Q0N4D2_9DIPT|nr:Zinc finger protein [Pseudolycoriella hygida]
MSQTYLYDSTLCRLCSEKSPNGIKLFISEERDISELINQYLPLKISDDRRYPRWICPGCHLQVESTVEFFDLVLKGQENLRCMLSDVLKESVDSSTKLNLFRADHVIYSRFGQPGKEKRKRGRPSKSVADKLKEQKEQAVEQLEKAEKESEELSEENAAGRRKRKIKLPSRFQEVVQGRELERIYVENGVIDRLEHTSDNDCFTNEAEVNDYSEGVIGHMEDTNGSNVVDLVFDSSKVDRKCSYANHKKKFICEICSRSYTQQLRYMSHKMSHQNVQYECIQCLEKFSSRKLISQHQEATQHTGEGIIESIETESNDDDRILQDSVAKPNEFSQLSTDDTKAMDVVFDEMDNIEETAAKVLYGLQNMDRTESPQTFATTRGPPKEMNSEFLSYTNFANDNETQSTEDEKTNQTHSVHEPKSATTDGTIINSSVKKKRHDCSICNKTFANEALLSVHFQLIHKSSNANKCETTDNSDDTPKYPCDKCKRLFKSPSSVLYHKNSEHNHFRFVCSKCGKTFKHKQLLRRHQYVHSQERPYSCTSCGATFKTKPNLLNHLPIHNPVKNHVCNICEQSFAHKNSLKLHLLWHSGAKPFSCKVCGKSFSQNGNLQEHMRIHTNVRPFGCKLCDKTFKTSSQCQIHSKRHDVNLKPFSCHICSKSFLQLDILKTHIRRHNNEKPFSCSKCDKSFSEHWALIKHGRTHTKEKPYKCPLCAKTFADCSNLAKHKKTHQSKTSSQNGTSDAPSTSVNVKISTSLNKEPGLEKLGKEKSNEISEENLFDPIELADIATSDLSDSVWRLADQNNVSKDNQIFYVTYQDPNLGNKTVKLVNQVNSLPSNQVDSSSELNFTSDQVNGGDGGSTSNIQLLAENSENIVLDENNLVINDQSEIFDMNSAGLELITSDGRKLRFLQSIP